MIDAIKILVREIKQNIRETCVIRVFDVQLHQPKGKVLADDVLALPQIPPRGEQHPNINTHCTACFREAQSRGPARWTVTIRYIWAPSTDMPEDSVTTTPNRGILRG